MSNEVLDGGAVREVERLARAAAASEIIEVGGRKVSTKALHETRIQDTEPAPVKLSTLASLAEYVRGSHDRAYVERRARFVHVESPTVVRLVTGIYGDFNQRTVIARVDAIVPTLRFGDWHDPEDFNIALQAHFEESTQRAAVLSLVGGLKAEAVVSVEDDGTSQMATARKGVHAVANVKVPNPVALRPYRTFAEVAQVEALFVLRLRGGGEGDLPECALFEADGGKWRLTAIERIKAWLKGELKDACEVYG